MNMKRKVGLIVVSLFLVLTLVGCSSGGNDPVTNPEPTNTKVDFPDAPQSLKDGKGSGYSIEVSGAQQADDRYDDIFRYIQELVVSYNSQLDNLEKSFNTIIKHQDAFSFSDAYGTYDVLYSTKLSSEVNESYDEKYTLYLKDTKQLVGKLYKNYNNTMARYVYNLFGENEAQEILFFDYGNEQRVIFIRRYLGANSDDWGDVSYSYTRLIEIVEDEYNGKTKVKSQTIFKDEYSYNYKDENGEQATYSEKYLDVFNFAAIEDSDTNRTTGVAYLDYGSDAKKNGEPYDNGIQSVEQIKTFIKENPNIDPDPQSIGIYNSTGLEASGKINELNIPAENPSKEDVLNFYDNSKTTNLNIAYSINIKEDNLGSNLVDLLEKNNRFDYK